MAFERGQQAIHVSPNGTEAPVTILGPEDFDRYKLNYIKDSELCLFPDGQRYWIGHRWLKAFSGKHVYAWTAHPDKEGKL